MNTTPPLERVPPWSRLLLAGALTLGALPYTFDRALVMGMMVGRPEWRFVALFVVALFATAVLTWGLAPSLSPGLRRLILPFLLVAWVAEHALLVWSSVGKLSPRPALFLVLSASTLWIPWTAWLFYGLPGKGMRFAVLAVFLAASPAFPLAFRVEGLTGEALVNFTWRGEQPSAGLAELDFPGENVAAGAADLTRTTPHDFPQFLGPERRAVVRGVRLARDWVSTPPRLVWRRPVGEGWSGFAVVGAYAITQEQRGDYESVTCYRLADGARVWLHADRERFGNSMNGIGPRATPTVAGGRVYAVGATGLLNCLDGATGKQLWSVNILEDNGGASISHGVCGSPLVVDDLVVVCPTGREGVSLAAYHRETGQRVWQGGENQASYASPLLAELAGVRQILLHNTAGVAGHDVATGRVLWRFPWTNGEEINCGMPIVNVPQPGMVFAATGYGQGSTVWKVADPEPEQVWQGRQMKAKFTTAVEHQGHAYGLDDGYLACVDLKTGRAKWKERRFRYKHGQVLLVGDLLLIQAEDGDVCLVEATPEGHRELGSFPALDGKTWNNPALAGRFLLVRNAKEAACFELPTESEPRP